MIQTISINDRIQGMLWGQFLGDAASLGTHWIYDSEELKTQFPQGIQGFETPLPGHYHFGKKSGDFTHYGDAALILLESIADRGMFDEHHFGASWFEKMSPENGYKGYFDGASKGTFANFASFQKEQPEAQFTYQLGANDNQLATISNLAPVIAVHYKSPDLLAIVKRATLVRQNNPIAVAYNQVHTTMLCQLLQGLNLEQTLDAAKANTSQQIVRRIDAALAHRATPIEVATQDLGQSCPLDKSFPSALVAYIQNQTNFKNAIIATIQAGGDQAGRAAMIGAWLGAQLGFQNLPSDWIDAISAKEKIAQAMCDLSFS